MTVAYPRLQRAAAAERLDELNEMTHAERRAQAATADPKTDWYPTTPARVDEAALRSLQSMIREVAEQNGCPEAGGRSTRLTEFDRAVAPRLHAAMDISPAEAAAEGVWSFLSLVLVPDVALWRFPNTERRRDYERLIGRPRNVLRRLWWRAYILGEASADLREDEAVAILERPTLGFDRRIAHTVATAHLAKLKANPSVGRTELLRDVTKRLRRLSVPVTLAALSDEDLAGMIDGLYERSLEALGNKG